MTWTLVFTLFALLFPLRLTFALFEKTVFVMFDILNIPVRTTPSLAFRSADKNVYGRITQAATGHGYLGSFYSRFNFDTPSYCSCSDKKFLSRSHTLFMCPEHADAITKFTQGKTAQELFDFRRQNMNLMWFLQNSSAFKKKTFGTDKGRPPDAPRVTLLVKAPHPDPSAGTPPAL